MDFDFLSSNLQIAYPFRDIITVMQPGGSAEIQPLVAAIRVYTYDQREAELYLDEVDLQSSDSFDTLDVAKLTLRWSDDDVQFTLEDGVNAVAYPVVYGAWVVVRWRHTTEDFVFHLVFPLAAADVGSSSSPSGSPSPGTPVDFRFWKDTDDITILASLVKQGPEKVKKVYVKRGSTLTEIAGPGDELSIRPGFNMEIEAGAAAVDDGGRKLTRVAVNAVPGAGLGRYLLCKGSEYLLTLNGVGPDDVGNTKFAPEECYWLDIPIASGPTPVPEPQHNIERVATLRPNQVRLRNACGPCCSCEDYVKTYDHLKEIWARAQAVAARIDTLRAQECALVAALTTKLPGDEILFLSQSGSSLVIQVSIWNDSTDEITDDITITLEITLEGSATRSLQLSVVSGFGAPQYPVVQDPTGDPNITLDDDMGPYQVAYWNTMWAISGLDVGDIATVTATISGGMTKSETEELTWADLG